MKSRMLTVLLFVAFASYAQTGTVKGRVVDAKTFKPLPFASVYLNQTTIGSNTNDEGDFIIQNIPEGKYEIVVSYLGYQNYQSRITINDSIPLAMSIKMIASTTNLEEVLVQSKKDEQWDDQYKKFQKQFLGVNNYTNYCKIINPWVLEFSEDNKGMLTAKASLPIEIENMGLGYKISFTLKEFNAGDNLYKIAGTYRFTEAQTIDTTLSALWERRREEVYRGSSRHLFKAIIDNRLAEEGYDLYTDISNTSEIIRNTGFLTNIDVSLKPLHPTGIVERNQATGQYTIKLPKRAEIHYVLRHSAASVYRNIPHPVSWIESTAPIEVNADGVVLNPNRMVVLGAMSEARVSEILPLDYAPNKKIKRQSQKLNSSLALLVEKPYLATDKPYYYPTDAILFKAFFNYVTPAYRDSLSQVIHVELIDASKNIIQSKLFPVFAGSAFGEIQLPSNAQPGDYTLRAYTRWMMNFDKELIFSKSLKILSPSQLVKPTDIKPVSKQIAIKTEKDQYETREKISITLEASNSLGNLVASDLVVSITDIEQAVVPTTEKNILTEFEITKEMLPDTSLKKPKYLIQYGIDFKGQMISAKQKNINGLLTIYQDNVKDVFAIATDADGKFHQEVQLMDSVDLLVAAKTTKGQNATIVIDEIKDQVPSIDLASPIALDIYKTNDTSKYHRIDKYSTSEMLQSVTIEASRIKTSPTQKHLIADRVITGETLRATNAVDLLSALQGRMSGLMVVYTTDFTGTLRKLIGFTNGGRGKFLECMLVINGAIIPTGGGETMGERLAAMTVHEVESVEVLRHAGGASIYGVRSANGVIIIKLRMDDKASETASRPDRSKLQVVNLDGFAVANEFKSPDYSEHTSGDDRADYRSTIYWNPHATTDGTEPLTLSFYAADIPTHYRIVVEGVTADGEPVRGEKIIVVTGKK